MKKGRMNNSHHPQLDDPAGAHGERPVSPATHCLGRLCGWLPVRVSLSPRWKGDGVLPDRERIEPDRTKLRIRIRAGPHFPQR